MTHVVSAKQIVKIGGPLQQWRFVCTCGREGKGWHNTPEKAIAAGQDHIPTDPAIMDHEATLRAIYDRLFTSSPDATKLAEIERLLADAGITSAVKQDSAIESAIMEGLQ